MLISFLILTDLFFIQTATDNRRCCSTALTMPCKTNQQEDKITCKSRIMIKSMRFIKGSWGDCKEDQYRFQI